MRVFVAGATGAVGFEFVGLAKARGYFIHTLSRSPENARKLAGLADRVDVQDACTGIPSLEGIDVVVSSLGGPVTVNSREKRPYREIDLQGNRRLLDAALAAGVKRFLYVSVHLEAGYRQTAYIQAHEEFVDALRRSGLNYSVIRPTGIFAAFGDFVNLARKGLTTVIGDGRARTKNQHTQIDGGLPDAGQALGRDGLEGAQQQEREAAAENAAGNREEQAFGQGQPRQPGARGAQSGAYSDFAIAADGAGQQEVGNIGAGNQEHGEDGAEESEGGGAGITHLAIAQGAYA